MKLVSPLDKLAKPRRERARGQRRFQPKGYTRLRQRVHPPQHDFAGGKCGSLGSERYVAGDGADVGGGLRAGVTVRVLGNLVKTVNRSTEPASVGGRLTS